MRLVPDDVWAVLTIYQEARGEPSAGKLAVAEVIRNRTKKRYFSDGTVVGTVLHPDQFSGWNTDDPNRLLSGALDDGDLLVQACALAWQGAVTGSDTVDGALLYFNPAVRVPPWAQRCVLVATIGRHQFYRP